MQRRAARVAGRILGRGADHPYYELTDRGIEVTIASPDGGKVEVDPLSDPRDASRWSAEFGAGGADRRGGCPRGRYGGAHSSGADQPVDPSEPVLS